MRENHATEQTSLGILCDQVIEAGWLGLVVVVPLFLNVYSYRSFEPDKIALLRSIALAMTAAWMIKMLEARTWKPKANSSILMQSLPSLRVPEDVKHPQTLFLS